jgi:KaiC/GvpD/RAD55 family RecA-like ATPase
MDIKNVNQEEFSKLGRIVYTALAGLKADGSVNGDGTQAKTVYLAATEVHNADAGEIKAYIKEIEHGEIPEIQAIHGALSRKRIINSLVNEASDQVASGEYSLLALKSLIETHTHTRNTLVPLCKEMKDVKPPEGMPIPCLERITQATGGLYGVWLIGGEPAAGKSTLALQLSLSVGRRRPVLYYDFEQGTGVIKWHIKQALGNDREKIQDATKQLYIRHSMSSLESDLDMLQQPALVVVDSIQKVASSVTYRRESLESWIHKLEALKKYGHHVIMVSEKNRGKYGEPSLSGYKESGELEYAADSAFDLIGVDPENDGPTDLYVTKNRHYKKKGFITQLVRKNSWWFVEGGAVNQGREID